MLKTILIITLLLFIWSFFIEPNLLIVKHYKVEALSGIKVVFVSDFHISKLQKGRLKRIVKLINKQNPDLILSGGDFIKGHDGKNTLSIEEQAEILKNLKAPFITVLGNHDGWFDKTRVTNVLKDSGFTVLSNSNTKFNDIYICGLDDIQTGKPDIEKALENTDGKRILITHSPDIYYNVKDSVDLILAGHTHGGQVSFPPFGAPIVPSEFGSKFANRIIKETQNTMIITKGIGTSILPVRFCSVPEIVVIN